MRTKGIVVPVDIIREVAQKLAEHEITNEITGITEDDDVIIEVEYGRNERPIVFEIEELIDDWYDDGEEEEDDDD